MLDICTNIIPLNTYTADGSFSLLYIYCKAVFLKFQCISENVLSYYEKNK